MFSNGFYWATVYKTGDPTAVKCIGPILKMVLYPIATINLNPIFHLFFCRVAMIRYETCFWKTTGGLLESASLYWLYKFWALFSLSVYAKPSEKTTTETTTTNIDPGRKVGIIMILHKNPIPLLERRKILRKTPNRIKMKKLCWCCSELTKK